jgi:hypothetical protein
MNDSIHAGHDCTENALRATANSAPQAMSFALQRVLSRIPTATSSMLSLMWDSTSLHVAIEVRTAREMTNSRWRPFTESAATLNV